MPLLGFNTFRNEILDGRKRHTIRLARKRKHQIKVGDKLFLYWKLGTKNCEKLGEAICVFSHRSPGREIEYDNYSGVNIFKKCTSYLDGFSSRTDFTNTLFDVIRWSYPLTE